VRPRPLWRREKLGNLLKNISGPKRTDDEASIAKDSARIQHCVAVRAWCDFLGILQHHERRMNHNQHSG